jgi:tetratricopeptide (TPR) repeat protein
MAVLTIAAGRPDELLRRGNAAYARGDLETADRSYTDAAERTTDPGLAAFNRAAVLVARGAYRDAELHYIRTLADAAIPTERRQKALYNLGVCRLKLGGDAAVYRSAIACFQHCLEIPIIDPALEADARHNLEVAKVLWNQARGSEATPPKANDATPDDWPTPLQEPTADLAEFGDEIGPTLQNRPRPVTVPQTETTGQPLETETLTPGPGTLPVLPDSDTLLTLSLEECRAWLKQAAARIAKQREETNRLLAGPERTDVRDW